MAKRILSRYDDKDFSLTDATSFVIMERMGIPYAFAFDRHSAQYGLTLLTPARSVDEDMNLRTSRGGLAFSATS